MTTDSMIEFLKTNQVLIFLILGGLTFCLSLYLGILLYRLKLGQKEIEELKKQQETSQREREIFYRDSISTICLATIQEQCELSEACLRLRYLLHHFPEIQQDPQYMVIENMYAEIASFATLEDRSVLTKQERYNQDKQRFAIEKIYQMQMFKALEILRNNFSVQ